MEISIVAGKREEFVERVAKLSKKLKKEVKFVDLGNQTVDYKGVDEEGNDFEYSVTFAKFEVDIDEHLKYNVNGFEFFAMVKDDGQNPLVISPDKEAFKRLDLNRVFECPHCHRTIQNRKTKVFLQKEGELFAFGSKCATEYFGDSFKFLTKNLGFFEGFEEEMRGFAHVNVNDVRKYLYTVALTIKGFRANMQFKWMEKDAKGYDIEIKAKDVIAKDVSFFMDTERFIVGEKKHFIAKLLEHNEFIKAEGGPESLIYSAEEIESRTAAHMTKYLEEKKYHTDKKAEIEEILKGEDFKNIIAFYKDFQPSDNFGFNVKNQFNDQGNVTGILVYGVFKYFWDEAKKTAAKLEPKVYDRFPGQVGDKIKDVKVKLVRFNSFETDFGTKFVYSFVTEKQEQLTIFSMGQLPVHCGYNELEEFKQTHADVIKREDGQEFRTMKFGPGMDFLILKGTIKEQKDYKGVPQTIIKLGRRNQVIAA